MTSPNSNPNDTFWLARYAHNQLEPLFDQAKAIEPTLSFHIEINFADEDSKFGSENYVSINAHWDRGGMFQSSSWLRDKADADRFVAKVKADVANLETLATA
jgi:hypothetical protein